MVWLWIAMAVVAIVLIIVPIHYYNRGITLRNRCSESWSNVDTELKRRYDLIPNLVAAVKGAAAHERETLDAVAKARAAALAERGRPAHQADTERPLVMALERLLAVAEDYPELKANRNFLQLQEELAITEDRIQAARRFYNANVRDQHNHLRQFPGNVFARLYKFEEESYFEVEPVHRAVPRVS